MRPRDERPFAQRRSLEEMKGCHAITHEDALVEIVEWEKTTYWGEKILRVRDAAPGPGHKFSWMEPDSNLTPAFPEEVNWLQTAQALRATRHAEEIGKHTPPRAAQGPRRRI